MDALDQGFRFGDLRIDPLTGEIAGPGGRETLDPKVMAVLVLMARRAGRPVSRDELLESVWPGSVVSDDAVNRCFYELRRQMSRAGGDDRYRVLIETLPKRGYRLKGVVAPLEPVDSPAPQAAASPRRRLTGGIALAAVLLLATAALASWLVFRPDTPPRSIAVLPFVDMSETQDQQYLSDGIAEEIIDRLADTGDLRVIARTSSFAFRNRDAEIPEIASRLDVSHVLEGSLRRSGDRIRITAQLVEADGAAHVWSETYDRTLGELFAVQDDIADAVAKSLSATLVPARPAARGTANSRAYENFLQAEFHYNRRGPGDIERAVHYYEEAIELDPRYARAWAALSGACGLMWWQAGADPAVWRARQGEAARRAVELDPELAEGHYRLAAYHFDTSNWSMVLHHARQVDALKGVGRGFERFALTPPSQWSAESELEQVREDVARDPLASAKRKNLGLLLLKAGRLEEAFTEFRKVHELNPDEQDALLEAARTLVLLGRHGEASTTALELPPSRRDYAVSIFAGDPRFRAESDAALARLASRAGDYMHHIRVAEAHAIRGSVDRAFASLLLARESLPRDESILSRYWFLQREFFISPFLETLQADPRWARLTAMPQGDSASEIIEALWPASKQAAAK